MYPAALHKVPTQTVFSPKVFEKWILQKQPKMINKLNEKSSHRNTISDLFVPDRTKISSLDCCRQRQFYLDYFYLIDQSSVR